MGESQTGGKHWDGRARAQTLEGAARLGTRVGAFLHEHCTPEPVSFIIIITIIAVKHHSSSAWCIMPVGWSHCGCVPTLRVLDGRVQQLTTCAVVS